MTDVSAPTTQSTKRPLSPGMIAVALLAVALIAVLGWRLRDVNTARPTVGQAAPPIDMLFFNGYEWQGLDAATLNDMRGNVVVLNFWASWCIECRVEADLLEQTWLRYKDDGVIMLGIAYTDLDADSHRYLEEFNVSYPNAPDLKLSAADDYGITGVPETFIIDQNGVVQYVKLGPVNPGEIDAVLARLLPSKS